jgi:geranylgeranyl transferase type-1 subunit beta
MSDKPASTILQFEKHLKYLAYNYKILPEPYASQDNSRLTLVYFIVSTFELFDKLDLVGNKQEVIDWIYGLQVLPDKDEPEKNYQNCGFRGSPFIGLPFDCSGKPCSCHIHDQGHLAMTYVALLLLLILGDDLGRVNKRGIIESMKRLQQPDGSFAAAPGGNESDARFLYCACVISHVINDWSGIDRDKAAQYVLNSQSYDGGIAQGPRQESHGGSTYCSIAALHLMGRLDILGDEHDSKSRRARLLRWLFDRQSGGFNGRANKPQDACYAWWVGASILLLGKYDLVQTEPARAFVLSCQRSMGGVSKSPDTPFPDVMHTYLGLAGLSFMNNAEDMKHLLPVDPALNCTVRTAERLKNLHVNN